MTVNYFTTVGGLIRYNILAGGGGSMELIDAVTNAQVDIRSTTGNISGPIEWSLDNQYIICPLFATIPYARIHRIDVNPVTLLPELVDVDSGTPTMVSGVSNASWSSNGDHLYVTGNAVSGTGTTLRAYELTGTNTWSIISPDPFSAQPGDYIYATHFNPADPTMFAAGTGDSPSLRLYSRNLVTNAFTDVTATKLSAQIATTGRFVNALRFSPDGNWLVLAVNSSVDLLYVYYYSVDGDDLTYEGTLFSSASEDTNGLSLAWTPDSNYCYLQNADSQASTNTHCWDFTGASPSTVTLTNDLGGVMYLAISADGTKITGSNRVSGTSMHTAVITPATGQLSAYSTFSWPGSTTEVGGIAYSNPWT